MVSLDYGSYDPGVLPLLPGNGITNVSSDFIDDFIALNRNRWHPDFLMKVMFRAGHPCALVRGTDTLCSAAIKHSKITELVIPLPTSIKHMFVHPKTLHLLFHNNNIFI